MLDIVKIKSALRNSLFIDKVIYFPEIDSTNAYSKSFGFKNAVLVLTDNQYRGFGREKRSWESEKGKNLTFTIKKSFNIETVNIQAINFFFTYFLLAYIKDYVSKNLPSGIAFPDISIKWPNDIILDSKKISGILIESNLRIKSFAIGIGINLNQKEFPFEIASSASSLGNFVKKEINLSEFLIGLLNAYENNVYLLEERKYSLIFKLWKESSTLLNREVDYIINKNNFDRGKVIDFQEDGSIIIEQNGVISTYYSGDIRLQL